MRCCARAGTTTPQRSPTPPELRLTRSEFTPDYEVCVQGRCQPMADWMASDGGVTLLKACRKPE